MLSFVTQINNCQCKYINEQQKVFNKIYIKDSKL